MRTRSSNSTTQKTKNFVASKPLHQTTIPAEVHFTSLDDDNQSVGNASTSSSKRSYSLFPFQQGLELCELIEANGGIATFGGTSQKLARLFDELPGLPFGVRGDPIRTTARKKVQDWQRYKREGTYKQKVLDHYGVKSSEERRKEARRAAADPTTPKPISQTKPFVDITEDIADITDSLKSLGVSHVPKSPFAPPIVPQANHSKVVDQPSQPSPTQHPIPSIKSSTMSAMSALIAKGRPVKPTPWPSSQGEMPPRFTGKSNCQSNHVGIKPHWSQTTLESNHVLSTKLY